MLKGITVKLHVKTQTGTDTFHAPIYSDSVVDVQNVLVAPVSSEAMAQEMNVSGKKIVYQLAIPKGDQHVWNDTLVEFFGSTFKTVGFPQQGIDELIPLRWNKKISVERYG